MSETTYNGWKNYPTWAVNLWLCNDEGFYREATERVAVIARESESRSEFWTLEESHRYAVAEMLKDFVWDVVLEDERGATLGADLLGWAYDHVDWDEIANAWLADANIPA